MPPPNHSSVLAVPRDGSSAPEGSSANPGAPPLSDRLHGPVSLDVNGVWRIPGQGPFGYTDGEPHERYLGEVFARAVDLGSDSFELETHIRDWVTEYHLSRKRSQLLRGFGFAADSSVLEVGCGCGAITRFLGETFRDVVAVEGSAPRATLARMRTRGMANVSVLCAPFHEIRFKARFDIIFCVGVFEYSKLFVKGRDPHEAVLDYFRDALAPGGAVVVAIENQFGLKYFASSAEDHNNIMFDGIEGYPRHDAHRTFGYPELKERLDRKFGSTRFYFPYPDYKLASCVVSQEALGRVDLGEMLGRFAPRDYSKARTPVFDQRLALMELTRNGMLHLFANSFLVVAGDPSGSRVGFRPLGVLYSDRRKREYHTVATIEDRGAGGLWVRKRLSWTGAGAAVALEGYEEPWQRSHSIQMQVLRRVKRAGLSLSEILEPCAPWMRRITATASRVGGDWVVEGRHVDAIWANAFVNDGECVFIDNEWRWKQAIRVNVLVARCAFYLLNEVRGMRDLNPEFSGGRDEAIVRRMGRALGVEISRRDWRDLLKLEREFVGAVATARAARGERLARKVGRAVLRAFGGGPRVT